MAAVQEFAELRREYAALLEWKAALWKTETALLDSAAARARRLHDSWKFLQDAIDLRTAEDREFLERFASQRQLEVRAEGQIGGVSNPIKNICTFTLKWHSGNCFRVLTVERKAWADDEQRTELWLDGVRLPVKFAAVDAQAEQEVDEMLRSGALSGDDARLVRLCLAEWHVTYVRDLETLRTRFWYCMAPSFSAENL